MLAHDPRFSHFKIGRDFLAEQAAPRPTPGIEDRNLRRRFVIFETSFSFDGAVSEEAGQ